MKTLITRLFVVIVLFINRLYAKELHEFDVTAFGAKGDGVTDDTGPIRTALLHAGPESVIWFPPALVFLSQPLNLTSHTHLQVDGILRSVNKEAEWPRLPPLPSYNISEDAGHYLQYQSFLYASHAHHIKITGNGEIDGNGEFWWDAFINRTTTLSAGRPNLIQLVHCHHVEITGVTLRDAPFWCLHPVYCRHVHVHHTTIRARTYAPNVDGIDPDSCQHVMIEYNDIGCGDDHIAIKAGRCGSSASRDRSVNDRLQCATDDRFRKGLFETNNVTVRYNIFRNGMGIAVGSEMSGSIRDVDIYRNAIGVCKPGGDCDDDACCGWSPALHVKTTLSRGGALENISFRDNLVFNTSGFILLNLKYQTQDDEVPKGYDPVFIRNISFVRNKALGTGTGARWACSLNDPCHEINVIDNYIATDKNPWGCQNIQSFTVSGNHPAGLEECMEQSFNGSRGKPDQTLSAYAPS